MSHNLAYTVYRIARALIPMRVRAGPSILQNWVGHIIVDVHPHAC